MTEKKSEKKTASANRLIELLQAQGPKNRRSLQIENTERRNNHNKSVPEFTENENSSSDIRDKKRKLLSVKSKLKSKNEDAMNNLSNNRKSPIDQVDSSKNEPEKKPLIKPHISKIESILENIDKKPIARISDESKSDRVLPDKNEDKAIIDDSSEPPLPKDPDTIPPMEERKRLLDQIIEEMKQPDDFKQDDNV